MQSIRVNSWINLLVYLYIFLCIISVKIFRENRNLHIFAGHTGHSSYAGFGGFFLLTLPRRGKTSEEISFKYFRYKYLSRLA